MLVIEILLGFIASWAGLFYICNWISAARNGGDWQDAVIYKLGLIALVLALGFLGLLVK